jgi:hypothetical protein
MMTDSGLRAAGITGLDTEQADGRQRFAYGLDPPALYLAPE